MTPANQLKSLSMLFCIRTSTTTMMEKCNRLFKFVLDSCTLLEKFPLYGEIEAQGVLDLDFRQHAQLKDIEIDLQGCRCYTFNNDFDIKWINIGKKKQQEEISASLINAILNLMLLICLGWKAMMSTFN